MAYTPWSVVFGETPTATKWNQLGVNDAGFRDGSLILLDNTQALQGKDSGGSTQPLLRLGSNDMLDLSQIRTQTHDSEVIADQTRENLSIQSGYFQNVGDGSTTMIDFNVTFPTAFPNSVIFCGVWPRGYKSSQADDYEDVGINVPQLVTVIPIGLTKTGFQMSAVSNVNFSGSNYYVFHWLAIGR